MSVAAEIERVTETDEGYVLELTGHLYRNPDGLIVGVTSPGQKKLTIINPMWKPDVGMLIWGGSDTAIIEAKPQRVYDRVGYTRLKERGVGLSKEK